MTRQTIDRLLDQAEDRHAVRILYAAESGSRAWGFPSPDSDYDVRFLYVAAPDAYLAVQEPPSALEFGDGDLIDGSGWELRKALRLTWGGNVTLFEWGQSPIIYRNIARFRVRLWEAIRPYFHPVKGMHHYLGTAKGMIKREWQGDTINLKRYFYVIRPVLAARWIAAHGTPPPIRFGQLLPSLSEADIRREIDALLALKLEAREGDRVPRRPELESFLETEIDRLWERAGEIHFTPPSSEALDRFFREWLMS